MKDLSILIPARNEMFLARTIEDILKNIEADTEVIAVLDGAWADPPIPQHERVNLVYVPKSIGQRAATNLACKLSKAKYVMKLDAHCSFDKGFDRKMLEAFKETSDNVTMVPIMRNLWAFDWKCLKCGKRWYQGPTPTRCKETNFKHTGKPCDSTKFTRKMIWIGKDNPQSASYCFDSTPHFQYFEDWKHRPTYEIDKKEKGLTQTLSLQGSAWMLTRDKYWELNICDENFGSWGSQGIEVALKTWLSGGSVLVNHKTWYAHMFRTQGGDFGFPYPISTKDQKKAKEYARNLFFNNNWDKQIHPLSWLIEKFWPVRGWSDEDLQKLRNNTFRFSAKVQDIPATSPDGTSAESEPTQEAPAAKQNKNQAEKLPEKYVIFDTNISRANGEPNKKPLEANPVTDNPKKKFKKITIIGHGWVGKSVHNLFPDAYVYNRKSGSKNKANEADIAFICVPTPTVDKGKLDTSIVEECVAWCECPLIVVRSTLNPGTCDYLARKYKKRIIMQPEYLGETAQHPLLNEKSIPFLVIGGNPQDRRTLINLYATVYNANVKIRQVTAYEAEVIKLSENRAIAFKVAQCQELYDACEKAGLDYYTIRDAVYGDDPRFNLWWTFVYPDKRGFESKCLPKDVYAWCAWAESLGYDPEITKAILERNKKWVNAQELITDNEIPQEKEIPQWDEEKTQLIKNP